MNIKLPYNLVIFFLLIFLFQCSHLSVYSQDTSFLKKRIPFPNCENLSYKSCIESKIKNAEFVFEGTVVNVLQEKNKQGDLIIEVIYEIHKVFKGNLRKGRVKRITDKEKTLQFYRDFYRKNGMPLPDGFARWIPRVGDTEIIIANKCLSNYKGSLEVLENTILLEEPYDTPIFVYELDYDNFYPPGYEKCMFYSSWNGEQICFKNTLELYSFIRKALNSSEYVDLTNQHFEKMDRSEWIKKKYKN